MTLFNNVTNCIEDSASELYFDYDQEVANTGFGDMLHDTERNSKFYEALRIEIERLKSKGKKVHVLDIGTGTGLLAMMAAKLGADTITACERFTPMANCAEEILCRNGLQHKVQLIKKSSFDIKVGVDMPHKANILVTELLDTELIGEGAISIYNHAHEHLLTHDVVCIPNKAICYAQIISSPLYAQLNRLKLLADHDGDVLLRTPKEIEICAGVTTVHDLQLSQMPLSMMQVLSSPTQVFEFNFSSKSPLALQQQLELPVKLHKAGTINTIVFWWDIDLDVAASVKLSCAPHWTLADYHVDLLKELPWREHWMQAFYYLPQPLQVYSANTDIKIIACHDEYSMWFNVLPLKTPTQHFPRPKCDCNFHNTHSRNRIGQLNDFRRSKLYTQFLELFLHKGNQQNINVLTLGDSCMLGVACARYNADKVYCYEPHRLARDFLLKIVDINELKQIKFLQGSLETAMTEQEFGSITHIFAEPHFYDSQLPWDNFKFGHLLYELRNKLPADVQIAPFGARIYAMPISFQHLHKIRKPVDFVEGFDVKPFDDMVEKSRNRAQSHIEAQPLWEYQSRALAEPHELFNISFYTYTDEISVEGDILIKKSGCINGVALWVDWIMDNSSPPKFILSTGPTNVVEMDSSVQWNMFTRQGVYFLPQEKYVDPSTKSKVHYKVIFKPLQKQLDIEFDAS